MKLVVIGGNGFIGSHFVSSMVERGHDVVVCGHSTVPKFAHGRAFTMLDGGIAELVARFAEFEDADAVCQFASTTVPSTSDADPVRDIETNLVANVRLLEARKNSACRRIVYLSSGGAVYGRPEYSPMDERHPLNPVSSYGVVKVAVENYLRMFAANAGLSVAIVRPSNPFGPGQLAGGPLGAVPIFFDHIRRGKPIQIFGDGSTVRDFIYVSDVAELIASVVEGQVEGVFNCGSGVGLSLNGLIDMMVEVTGLEANRVNLPARAYDPPSVVLDTAHARKILPWDPKISLRRGLEHTWAWLKAQEEKCN